MWRRRGAPLFLYRNVAARGDANLRSASRRSSLKNSTLWRRNRPSRAANQAKKSNSESPCGEINRQELEKFADFIDQNLAIDVTLRVGSAIEDNCGFSKLVPMLNSVSTVA
jgi:hypothetical protein